MLERCIVREVQGHVLISHSGVIATTFRYPLCRLAISILWGVNWVSSKPYLKVITVSYLSRLLLSTPLVVEHL